jgi:hypothetical protein
LAIGLGDMLLRNPSLALDPSLSAKILAAFFKDRGVVNYLQRGDFIGARVPINGRDYAQTIARLAKKYYQDLSR